VKTDQNRKRGDQGRKAESKKPQKRLGHVALTPIAARAFRDRFSRYDSIAGTPLVINRSPAMIGSLEACKGGWQIMKVAATAAREATN
jgi:hypothetical protein